jgi:hypothetical protein
MACPTSSSNQLNLAMVQTTFLLYSRVCVCALCSSWLNCYAWLFHHNLFFPYFTQFFKFGNNKIKNRLVTPFESHTVLFL